MCANNKENSCISKSHLTTRLENENQEIHKEPGMKSRVKGRTCASRR
jgi:hypothetical protein